MTEPVMQGEIVKGMTQILVLPPTKRSAEEVEKEADSTKSSGAVSSAASDTVEELSMEDDGAQDGFADFDLDEAFLASSVLLPRRSHATPLTSPCPSQAGDTKHTSFPMLANNYQQPPEPGHSVQAVPLSYSVPSELLVPHPDDEEDDILRAYTSTSDLGRLGFFSGDWVLVHGPAPTDGGDARAGRLVRIFAADEQLPSHPSTRYVHPARSDKTR